MGVFFYKSSAFLKTKQANKKHFLYYKKEILHKFKSGKKVNNYSAEINIGITMFCHIH